MSVERNTIIQLMLKRGLFEGASADDHGQLVDHGSQETIASETLLIEQGKIGEAVWILLSGTVRIVENGKEKHQLDSQGTILGEISAVSLTAATATVQARDEVKALRISHQDFHKALTSNAKLANLVLRSMSKYL